MTAAVLYARYSTALQSAASVEDQLRLLRQRAEREGWAVAGEHADRAISGSVRARPGLEACMAALDRGDADVLLAEALDRISRDQEDIAAIFKRVRFLGTRIVTLSEGDIGTIHVGVGGTVSALFLEQLAEKTRRGQIGRVQAGRVPGGLSYGYRVVRAFAADGQPDRGLREVDEAQAAIVRRIFTEYADGRSPLAIAADLNAEGVPSPRGGLWRANAIVGHAQRKNGIIHNELYRGRIVYNRQAFRKDPETRKRVSRANAPEDVVTAEVEALRIVDADLWDRAALRIAGNTGKPSHQARRPKRLLSGLMTCGCCGGSYIAVGPGRWGCSNARQTGTCDNRTTLFDNVAQKRIWAAIDTNLLHPDVAAAYIDERRQVLVEERRRRMLDRARIERRLAELDEEDGRITDAIVAGIPLERLKDRATALAAERAGLRAGIDADQLAALDAAIVHPGIADHYRRRIAQLYELADGDEALRNSGRALLQELVEKIEITPRQGKRGCDMTLHGKLASILSLGTKPANEERMISMVAGAGFEPATFRL